MRGRFVLVGVFVAMGPALGQPASEAADPKGSSISVWSIEISPRGLELPASPDRFLTEVYDPEVGWSTDTTLFSDGAELGPGPERPRQNDPLFFRFTDFELDLSFTGYSAWDQLDACFFTYPINEEWRELLDVKDHHLDGCEESFLYGCSVFSTYSVADELAGPSYYSGRFLEGSPISSLTLLEFLPGNTEYPRPDWLISYANLGEPTGYVFRDPMFVACSPLAYRQCGPLPQGPIRYTHSIDGYTTSTHVTALTHCISRELKVLHKPLSPSSLSPSDILPPGFPFPPPDDFITMAIEDMLVARGNPVGFLQRAVQPRGPLYSTTSLSALPVGDNLDSNITWTLPELIGFPRVGVTVPLVVSGGVESTGAVSLALRLHSPVPIGKESLTAAPTIADTTFRDHIRAIDDHTLEYRCLAMGDFSTTGTTTLAVLTVVLPSGLAPGDRIDLIPLAEPVENVLPTSMVRLDNRPVVNPACGDGPCQVQATPGRIEVVQETRGVDMWIVLGEGSGG